MKTCAGYDSSAPQDVLNGIKKHLKKQNPARGFLDVDGCCLLQDVNSTTTCVGDECKHAANGKKKDVPGKPKDPL
jgi:hypothetical protein